MIQPQPQELTEKDKRIDQVNNALNTITNLQAQLNGMSSQLSMILGNLGNLAKGLQDNIQWLVADGTRLEEKVNSLKEDVAKLTPQDKDKPQLEEEEIEKI